MVPHTQGDGTVPSRSRDSRSFLLAQTLPETDPKHAGRHLPGDSLPPWKACRKSSQSLSPPHPPDPHPQLAPLLPVTYQWRPRLAPWAGSSDETPGEGPAPGARMAGRALSLPFFPDIRAPCSGHPGADVAPSGARVCPPPEKRGLGWAAPQVGGCPQGSGAGRPPTTARCAWPPPPQTHCLPEADEKAKYSWASSAGFKLPGATGTPEPSSGAFSPGPWTRGEEGGAHAPCPVTRSEPAFGSARGWKRGVATSGQQLAQPPGPELPRAAIRDGQCGASGFDNPKNLPFPLRPDPAISFREKRLPRGPCPRRWALSALPPGQGISGLCLDPGS